MATDHERRTPARRTTRRPVLAVLLAVAVALAACGSSDVDTAADDSAGSAADTRPADRSTAGDDRDDAEEAAAGADDGAAAPATTTTPSSDAGAAAALDSAAPGEVQDQVGLRAGSVDDNEAWEAYLRYRDDVERLGLAHEELAVDGRRLVTVVDGADRPVHDAVVSAAGITVRTGADGRAVLLVPPGDQQSASAVEVTATKGTASVTVELAPAGMQRIVLADAPAGDGVRLDLLFLVDATGSMADEIERLKATMVGVAERIGAGDAVDARFALTSYRDVGDDYVARTVDFTADVDGFVQRLREVTADGGGDTPEAFGEAFAEAVTVPRWRTDDDVVRLVVLVADAPPHVGRGPGYVESIRTAASLGIRVFPIASSGTDDQAEYVFRQVAQATLGRFVFLSYGADGGGAAVGSSSNVDEVGYDVLALDDLVVRLVEEQLEPLTER